VFLVNLPVGAIALVAALRTLREERDPDAAGLPDLLGAVVLTGGVGALTAAIVEGPTWGWGDDRVIALFAAAAALLAVFARRNVRHPVPVVEPELLRVRSFVAANVAGLLFFAGFGAMLLGGVLFLTQVWDYSVLEAGVAHGRTIQGAGRGSSEHCLGLSFRAQRGISAGAGAALHRRVGWRHRRPRFLGRCAPSE
jgi:hypothetical protein